MRGQTTTTKNMKLGPRLNNTKAEKTSHVELVKVKVVSKETGTKRADIGKDNCYRLDLYKPKRMT